MVVEIVSSQSPACILPGIRFGRAGDPRVTGLTSLAPDDGLRTRPSIVGLAASRSVH